MGYLSKVVAITIKPAKTIYKKYKIEAYIFAVKKE
jgi:hypothetical protein